MNQDDQRALIRDLMEAGYFDQLLDQIDDDEYDQEVMPHYGLIPDYFLRWKALKNKVKELLYEDI